MRDENRDQYEGCSRILECENNVYNFVMIPIPLQDLIINCLTEQYYWHVCCLLCTLCETLLDGDDINNVICEDGSLLCPDCSLLWIETHAILADGEAFCEECFKCSICETRIGLKYARTHWGVLCVPCKQTLIKRRKMKRSSKRSSPDDQTEI